MSTISNTVTVTATLGAVTNPPTFAAPLTITSSGAVTVGGTSSDAVYGSNAAAWTVVNQGTVSSSATIAPGIGIDLRGGGSITNTSTGTVTAGQAIYITGAAGTITNAGLLSSGAYSTVYLGAGGLISNTGSIVQSGTTHAAVSAKNVFATVINSGAIVAPGTTSGAGVRLQTGSVSNTGTGLISGGYAGVRIDAGGTVINSGTISGTARSGVGVQLVGGGTIVDSGVISGTGIAINFGSGGSGNLLVLEHNYAIVGAIVAGVGATNTAELAGSVSGAVTASYADLRLGNFQNVLFGSGGLDTLKVSNTAGTLSPVISGFTLPSDTIDLTAIGNGVITQNDTVAHRLTVSGSGGTITFQLDTTDASHYVASSDGTGGTKITVSQPLLPDYNHDGLADILVRNELTGGLGFAASNAGSFTGTLTPATGGLGNLRYAGRGDVNGDGFADVVVEDPSSRRLYAALQDGSGTPNWATLAQVPGWTAKGVGDLNGDGYADIVIQNDLNGVVDYYDVHNATFATLTALPEFNVVGVGDVNGDGFADIVIQNPATGRIDYLNMAGGVYAGIVDVVSTPGWDVRAVGDLNGDGYADIVIQNSTGQTTFANMHGGALSGWGTATTGLTADYVLKDAADVNGDGYADVVVQQASTGTVYVALEGAGGFVQWGATFNAGLGAHGQVAGNGQTLSPTAALASDYTGSGTGDILFRNTTSGQLQFAVMSAGNVTGFGFATGGLGSLAYVGHGDVNGDGIADVVVQDPAGGRLYAALQDGSGSGAPTWQVLPQVPGWTGKAVGDLNGDGFADVVIQNDSNAAILYYDVHNAAFSALSTKNGTVDATGAAVVGAGDVNGDGFADVVLQNQSSSEIYYTSAATGLVDVGNPGAGFQVRAVADLTGFGFADIAVEDSAGNTKFLNMQGGVLQGFGMATTGLTSDYVIKDAVDVFNNGHAALIVQQLSTGTTFYAAQGSNGFDHWGAPINALGSQWQAV